MPQVLLFWQQGNQDHWKILVWGLCVATTGDPRLKRTRQSGRDALSTDTRAQTSLWMCREKVFSATCLAVQRLRPSVYFPGAGLPDELQPGPCGVRQKRAAAPDHRHVKISLRFYQRNALDGRMFALFGNHSWQESDAQSMIRKSAQRFSEKIMRQQRAEAR